MLRLFRRGWLEQTDLLNATEVSVNGGTWVFHLSTNETELLIVLSFFQTN